MFHFIYNKIFNVLLYSDSSKYHIPKHHFNLSLFLNSRQSPPKTYLNAFYRPSDNSSLDGYLFLFMNCKTAFSEITFCRCLVVYMIFFHHYNIGSMNPFRHQVFFQLLVMINIRSTYCFLPLLAWLNYSL